MVCGTFSKTLGTIGGFACGSKELITYLKLNSRPFIFSAALPPVAAATALACLNIIESQPGLLQNLRSNTSNIKTGLRELGFKLEDTVTPIIPILIGNDDKTFKMTGFLEEKGIIVNPVVPPAVQRGCTLIRVSVMASHTKDDIRRAVSGFREAGKAVGII